MSESRPLSKRYRLLITWSVVLTVSVVGLGALGIFALRPKDPYLAMKKSDKIEGLTSRFERKLDQELVRLRFDDIAETAGVRFRHFPAVRSSLLPEDMGSGLAWGDYDGDGDPDLLVVNFACSIQDPVEQAAPEGACQLFRNDGGTFQPVGPAARVDLVLYGMGAAWGDFDNDGFPDVYISAYGNNHLLLNNGDGTFTDVTDATGSNDPRFSSSVAWADYDRDGDLDLYVCNYVEFEYSEEDLGKLSKQYGEEIPFTINPTVYPPQPNALFQNDGRGHFRNVAREVGVDDPKGKSLAVAWFDFDNDGWLDIYVANDISANGVYRNRGDGTFEDIGASSLAADYRGAMGVAVGDFDLDQDLDMLVTHWLAQENAFFVNMYSKGVVDKQGNRVLFFVDESDRYGLGQISIKPVGWATSFVDFDNDGLLDLWVVNGDTLQVPSNPRLLRPQQMHLFEQRAPNGFFEVAAQACPELAEPFVGRGGAHADFDGDGRVDLAVLVHGGRTKLLHNVTPHPEHWIQIRLVSAQANRQAYGARIEVVVGNRTQMHQVAAQAPYLSQNYQTVHFGLGQATVIDRITVNWPDGAQTTLEGVQADREIVIYQRPSTHEVVPAMQ